MSFYSSILSGVNCKCDKPFKPANPPITFPARLGYNADEPDRVDTPVNRKLTFKAQPKKHIVSLSSALNQVSFAPIRWLILCAV